MICEVCSKKISKERLEALPDTTRCVKCSDAEKKVGLGIGDMVVLDKDALARINELEKIDGRMGRLK